MWRNWRTIVNMIKAGETPYEVNEYLNDTLCQLCYSTEQNCMECPLGSYMRVCAGQHWSVVSIWADGDSSIRRNEVLKSAEIICEIVESSVCMPKLNPKTEKGK